MFKKFISVPLAAVMALTTTITAFAAPSSPREEFLQALKKTADQWQYENDLFQEALPYNSIINSLNGKATETKIYAAANIEDTYVLYLENTSQADPEKNQLKNDTSVSLSNNTDSVDFQIGVYVSPEEIAVSAPSIYDKTLVINLKEAQNSLADSDIYDIISGTGDLSQLIDLGSLNFNLDLDMELIEAINDDYGQFFLGELTKGSFSYGRQHSLPLTDGNTMQVQDITLSFTAEQANEIFRALGNKIENDKNLYQYFYQIYEMTGYNKMMSTLTGENFDMAEMVIEMLVDICQDVTFSTNVNYTISLNNKGYAVKHTIVTTDVDSYYPTTISIEYETKGINYLTDDIRFAIFANDQMGIEVLSYGHSVPRNGNVSNTTKLNLWLNGKCLNFFGWDTSYNANREQDNLSFNCYLSLDFNSLYAPVVLTRDEFNDYFNDIETTLAELGYTPEEIQEIYETELVTYNYEDYLKEMDEVYSYLPAYDTYTILLKTMATIHFSENENILNMDFHTCTFEYDGNSYPFSFGYFIKPLNGSISAYNTNQAQSVFTLTQKEAETILDAIQAKLDTLINFLP